MLQSPLQLGQRLFSNVLLSLRFLCGVVFGRQEVPTNIRVEKSLLEKWVFLLLGLITEDCPFPGFTRDLQRLNPGLDSEFSIAVEIASLLVDFVFLDLLL